MLNLAIVGPGRWGRNLVDSAAGSETFRFAAGSSRTRQTGEAFCREKSLRWTGDLDALLRDPGIDGMVFATPHSLHADEVLRAAAAGKHVFVEKPFALSLADADRMIAAADKAGIVLAVGFNRRFHPSMVRLRDLLRSGRLGSIATINAEQTALHGLHMTADNWRARSDEAPGGAMTAIGVHLVDGMIDLNGPIASVFARVSRHAAATADDATDILLTFRNGASGHIFCSTAATPHYRMAVYGTGGFAEVVNFSMGSFRLIASVPGDAFATAPEETVETKGFNTLTAELEAFAASILEARPFPTPLSDIRHGVAVFEAIVRSAGTGKVEQVK